MSNLSIIEYQDQRVLTTSQLVESYGADNRRISENFKRNFGRYQKGKHYFPLQDEEKRDFLNHTQIEDGSKKAQTLYLWTEKGAWLHAKSLNTDEAWNAYEMLVDDYYRIKEQPQQAPSLEVALQAALEHERDIKTIKSDVNYLKGSMRIDSLQQQDLQQEAKKAVMQAIGGFDLPAYNEMAGRVFSAFWKEFKQHFKIPRYPDLPKVNFDEAIRFIQLWRPTTTLQIQIDNCNSQMMLT